MALLIHGNGKSYTQCLIIGTPSGSSDVNFIVEIHLAGTPSEMIKNPIINFGVPDDGNTADNNAMSFNLRRITESVKIEGYLYDTQNDTDIVYDHCYIETARGNVFNGTTGLVTKPTGADFTAQNITSALKKRWMLKKLAKAGAYATGGNKELLTLQIYQQYSPAASDEIQNIFHKKMVITSLTITPVDASNEFLVDGSDNIRFDKFKVSMELTWGDPNA